MKSYDRFVVWLEYLDSERKRSEGRRIRLDSCTRSPTLEELTLACERLKLEPEAQAGRRPGVSARVSGYVSIKKGQKKPKHAIMMQIARELSNVRGQRTATPKKV